MATHIEEAVLNSVTILHDEPRTGYVTICYCPEGQLVAKKLSVPKRDFMKACQRYADELAGPSSIQNKS